MPHLNIYILTYIAIAITFVLGHMLFKQRWSLFEFLHKDSIEDIERKLAGFDQSIIAKIITDDNGMITSANEAMEQMFGWKAKELVNNSLRRIVPERYWVPHSEGMKRAMGKEMEDRVFNIVAVKKDKSEIPIELLLRKRKIGGKFFYVAIFRDETKERKMIEMYSIETQELQSKVDVMEKGEELGATGSWFWDLRTSKEVPKSKLYTSRGYNKILGIDDQHHMEAEYLKSRVFSKDVEIVDRALKKAFKGEPYDITYRINRSSDFKVILIRSIVTPVKDAQGLLIGMYGSTKLIQTLNVIDIITE